MVITLDEAPLTVALENLQVGALQEVIAGDGSQLVVRRTAGEDLGQYYNPDGSEAVTANGDSYTVGDLTALALTFED